MNKGNINQTCATNDIEVISTNGSGQHLPIGLLVRNLFPQYGWYKEKISQINLHAPDGKIYHIWFDYGEQDDCSAAYIKSNANESQIIIGDIGFRFVHNFPGGGIFSGRFFEILANKKDKCKFDEDGEIKLFTIDQLEYYSKLHFTPSFIDVEENENDSTINNGKISDNESSDGGE